MKFFTDKTVVNDYLLVKIVDYWKMKDFSKWKEVFIDPGVWELTKRDEYSWRNLKRFPNQITDFLNSLPDNHYFSLDYPCDMNPKLQDYFLNRSWRNAEKYCSYPQYIVTVQSKFRNYFNFMECFDRYNALDIKSGILALGNMCRFRSLNQYLKHALSYAFYKCRHPRIHIYGLCLKAIPYAVKLAEKYNIKLSIDSMKWTFCYYETYVKKRQYHFEMYMEKVRKCLNV